MVFDHAQSGRLGQRLPASTSFVRVINSLVDLPEVAFLGQVVYVQDIDVFQVYDGQAWQTPSAAQAGIKTFVQVNEPDPGVDDIAIGDLWLHPETKQFQSWTGTAWTPFQVVDTDGNIVANINLGGDATVRDLNVSGIAYLAVDRVDLGGDTLQHILSLPPRGINDGFYAVRNPGVVGITTTDYGLMEAYWDAPSDVSARQYRMHYSIPCTLPLDQSYSLVATVRLTSDGTAPTITSPLVAESVRHTMGPLGGTSRISYIRSSFLLQPGSPNTRFRYLLTLRTSSGTVDVTANASLWMEDMGVRQSNVASSNTGGGVLGTGGSDTGVVTTPEVQQYEITVNATDTKWWGGAPNNTFMGAGDGQYFGNTTANDQGRRKSVIWFNKSAISAAIAGATIIKVELWLYLFDGGQNKAVAIGRHTDTTPSSNVFTNVDGTDRQLQVETNWDQGSGHWVELTVASLKNWDADLAGYIIGPQTNDTNVYAGGYRGATHSLHPKLRITYTK